MAETFLPDDLRGLHSSYQLAQASLSKQITWWQYLNIILQVLVIFLGLVAAIMIALQTDRNSGVMKPIGLIATILSSGILSSYNVFHIRETLDELISLESDLLQHTNDLDTIIRRSEKTTLDLDSLDLEDKYAAIFNELGRRRRALKGSIGGLLKAKEGTPPPTQP